MMPDTQRPNVVSFRLDDLGYGESCCFGYREQEESNRQGFSGHCTDQERAVPA